MQKTTRPKKRCVSPDASCLVHVWHLWAYVLVLLLCACSPQSNTILMPVGDIRPPSVVEARQENAGAFEIRFDEEVRPVEKSFAFAPLPTVPSPAALGSTLSVSLSPPAAPGDECTLSGEVQDVCGNTTRFLFSFVGYNEYPAQLLINEIQPGKNSSTSNPHRDYIEFIAAEAGNLGGVMVQWANSVKIMTYKFPSCETQKGELVVLHCAPEGIPDEKDEVGLDVSLSRGIDSSPGGRDFWTMAGGLPDESAVIVVRPREGNQPNDGIFYAALDKTGNIDSDKLAALIAEMKNAEVWHSSTPPLWEEGFLWKSSASRPLHRKISEAIGSSQWYVGDAGTQSPGLLEPGRVASKATHAKKGKSSSP